MSDDFKHMLFDFAYTQNATDSDDAFKQNLFDVGITILPTSSSGWTGKILGVTNPSKVNGLAVANITKINGIS